MRDHSCRPGVHVIVANDYPDDGSKEFDGADTKVTTEESGLGGQDSFLQDPKPSIDRVRMSILFLAQDKGCLREVFLLEYADDSWQVNLVIY